MQFLIGLAAGALLAQGEIFRADSHFERLEAVPLKYALADPSVAPPVKSPSRLWFFKSVVKKSPDLHPPTGQVFKSNHGLRVVEEGAAVGDAECQFYPEIVLVQDVSDSFQDDMANVNRLLPELFDKLIERYDGKVRFGMTSFVDKFVEQKDWGSNAYDYCAKVEIPLEAVDASLLAKVQKRISSLEIGGGGDYLDGANEAIVRTALSNQVGWTEGTHDPKTGRPIVRIMVVATDAGMHEAGYAQQVSISKGLLSGPLPPSDLVSHPSVLQDNINAACRDHDFPTFEDVRAALVSRSIIPIVFAGAPSWEDNGKRYLWSQYRDQVLGRFGQTTGPWADVNTGLSAFYGDYFSEQLKLDAVVQHLDESSSNLLELIDAALNEVQDLTCIAPERSTTLAPSPAEPSLPTASPTVPVVAPTLPVVAPTVPVVAPTLPVVAPTVPVVAPTLQVVAPTVPVVAPTLPVVAPTVPADAATTEQGIAVLPPIVPPIGVLPTSPAGTEAHPPAENGDDDEKGKSTGVVIGAASGGAAAAAAAGLFAAKKMGLLFNNNPASDMNVTQNVDNVDSAPDREQFEAVTGEYFA